jgi:hypothetical protein
MVVDHVPHGEYEMTPQHARAHPAHHLPDVLAHIRLVAMHGAIGAGRLGLTEDAALQSPARIVVQRGSIVTERCILRTVMAAAIHSQHGIDHRKFARAPCEIRLAYRIFVVRPDRFIARLYIGIDYTRFLCLVKWYQKYHI